jgi:hypothetical protein
MFILRPDIKLSHVVMGFTAFALMMAGYWISGIPIKDLEQLGRIAPFFTFLAGTVAAVIALSTMFVQRDTAKRRASIDFFLKTEMDEKLISAYHAFNKTVPHIPAMISRPSLDEADPDYQAIVHWLNVCELMAVGVIKGAFSESVALHYWGYVMQDAYNDAVLLINHIRRTPSLGGPDSFTAVQKLSERWRDYH